MKMRNLTVRGKYVETQLNNPFNAVLRQASRKKKEVTQQTDDIK